MIKVYEYPKCSTCKKAKKFIENNADVIFLDITKDLPAKDEIVAAIASYGDIKKAFNTSGMKYRELDLKNKLKDMDDETAIKLLLSDGMLIKRPFLVDSKNDEYIFGFKEEKWSKYK